MSGTSRRPPRPLALALLALLAPLATTPAAAADDARRADGTPAEGTAPATPEQDAAYATPAETVATPSEAAASKALRLGGRAPEFALTDIDGKRVTLSESLARGPVLLDFWALWCKPCLRSLPSTQAIHERFRERGLSVLAVNTDSPRSAAKVKSFVKSSGFTFGVPLDPNGTMQRLYRFYRIPQIFLIAPDGTVAFAKLGYSPGTEELLVAEIEKLIGPAKD
jgi:peroxiredoxin